MEGTKRQIIYIMEGTKRERKRRGEKWKSLTI